jgi:replicative DNA helicase
MQIKPPLKLFISYSHKDQVYLDEFTTHLSLLRREGIIVDWSDRKITVGNEWEKQIDTNLEQADLVVLLVSPDFIASDYCYGKELACALDMHESGKARVLPIIIRPCEWSNAPFSKIQLLPKDGLPVSKWDDRDDAWLSTVRQLRIASGEISEKNNSKKQKRGLSNIQECLTNLVEKIEVLYSTDKEYSGHSTGFIDLDTAIDGLHEGDLCVISSISSMERSDLAINIAALFVIECKLPVAIFSMRLGVSEVTQRMTSSVSLIPSKAISRGHLDENDWVGLTLALGKLVDTQMYINDSATLSLKEISQQIDDLSKQLSKNISLIVIDSVQHLQESLTGNVNDYAALCLALKRLAKEKKCTIIVTSKVTRNAERRPNKRPVTTDLEEWRCLEDHSDQLVFIHREEQYSPNRVEHQNVAELLIAKNVYGKLSTVYLRYTPEQSFYQLLVDR